MSPDKNFKKWISLKEERIEFRETFLFYTNLLNARLFYYLGRLIDNDDNTGRTMRVGPQSVSKKCGVSSIIEPSKSVSYNLPSSWASNGTGQTDPLTRTKKDKVVFCMLLCLTQQIKIESDWNNPYDAKILVIHIEILNESKLVVEQLCHRKRNPTNTTIMFFQM